MTRLILSGLACLIAVAALAAESGPGRAASPAPVLKDLQACFASAARAWAAQDFDAVRAECGKVLSAADAPPHYQSYARLRLAQSYAAQKDTAGAIREYEAIQASPAYPEVHRDEARECARELERAAKGLPARDVTASRTKIPPAGPFAVEYFVSAEGDDAGSGAADHPFQTLERARDAIRALKARGPLPGPVRVNVLPGEYPVRKTLELSAIDSGAQAAPIVYRAAKKGAAVLYGGARLGGFAPVTDAAILARLPAEARNKIFQCDLNQAGIPRSSPLAERGYGVRPPDATVEFFFNGAPLTLARWPNSGFVNGGKVIEPGSKPAGKNSVFTFLDERPARWAKAQEGWLFGYFRHGWADRTLKIQSIDTAARRIACAPYALGAETMEPVKWFNKGRIKYFAFNLPEELDQAGEWFLDRGRGLLFVYPPADPRTAVIETGVLSSPMLVMTQVAHVRLEGLVFDLSQNNCMWLKDCQSCLVAGCTIQRFAGGGIAIHGGRDNGILGCDLRSLGRGATEVTGGDRATLAAAGHFVENCLMHSLGRLDHTYVPGILMEGAGIRAAHNEVRDCPSSAIRFDGNDLLIEYNQVDRVLLESEDQGAMETYGNPTFRGNVLRHNSFAFIGAGAAMDGPAGRAGIRLDDAISGTLVYGNLFFHAAQSFGGVNLNGGRDNIIDNNLFALCEKGITGGYDPQNPVWASLAQSPGPRGFVQTELYLSRYPALKQVLSRPANNSVWRSVFWNCGPAFSTYGRLTREHFDLLENVEQNGKDLGFVDGPQGDLRLKPNAALLARIGFRPIPVEEIGLYPDEYCASWPPGSASKNPPPAQRARSSVNQSPEP